MQIEELYDLSKWIQKEVADKNIITYYQNLYQILYQNSQSNQPKQPFEDHKNILIQSLDDIQLFRLTTGQIEILSKLGIAQYLGQQGIQELEETLYRNALDIATATQKINSSIQVLNSGIQWASQLHSNLSTIVNNENTFTKENSVVLRVHFQKNANFKNLTDFKDWGKAWWEIGRGIAMAHGSSPEAIEVVGASKGSIIISLMTSYAIAKTTSTILLEVLKVAEKILELRKKVQEIRALKLSNDIAEKQLEKDIQEEKDLGIKKISNLKFSELGIENMDDGEKNKTLENSIKKLVDFVEKGGEIDFVIPEEKVIDEAGEIDPMRKTRDELRDIFSEVRRIEDKVKQLELKID